MEILLYEDIAHGLIAKTAIHPSQIDLIERHYRVSQDDLAMATAIVSDNSPAVFKMNNSMCEVATHTTWANQIITQSKLFGVSEFGDDQGNVTSIAIKLLQEA